MRQEPARQIRESQTELMRAINCLTFWMNGSWPRLWPLSWGLCGILIGKL